MSKHLSVLADLIKNVNLANIGISDLSFGLYKRKCPLPPLLVVMDAMTITTDSGGNGRYDHYHHLTEYLPRFSVATES